MKAVLISVALLSMATVGASQQPLCDAERGAAQLGITAIDCFDCEIRTGAGLVFFGVPPAIAAIRAGSAADNVLRTGDKVVRVNGHSITSTDGAIAWAGPHQQEARLEVVRGSRSLSVSVAPLPLCADAQRRRSETAASSSSQIDGLGIGVQCDRSCSSSFTNGQLTRWSFSDPPTIVVVDERGRGARAGLIPGDRIVSAGGHPITSAAGGLAFVQLARGADGVLIVERDRQRLTVNVGH